MNMDQIRARLQKLNQKTGKRRDLWKPKDKHVVRLLPYPHSAEPIIELGFHYELGDTRSVLCPKHNEGKECAVCDFAEKLRSWNDPDTGDEKPEATRKADFEIFKDIQVKERWYVPMVERGKEADGPKFWAFSKTIFESLLKICMNEENNEISGVEGTDVLTSTSSAFDLEVDFAQANNKDGKGNAKSYPATTITEKKRPSKLAKNKAEIDALIEKIVPITEVYQPVSSEEVEKIFNAWTQQGAGEPDTKDVGTEYQPKSAEVPVEGGQSIDDAFGEMVAD